MADKDYSDQFTDDGFWNKVTKFARVAGEKVLDPAFQLYYAWQREETPAWAKAVIIGALGYFISPVDAIPDVVPVVGFVDDAGVLVAAVATVAAFIDDEVRYKAKGLVHRLLGP